MPAKRVVRQCTKAGCVKIRSDRTCMAFSDPAYQWDIAFATGDLCSGITNSVKELRAIFDAMWNYPKKHNRLTRYFLRTVMNCLQKHDKED